MQWQWEEVVKNWSERKNDVEIDRLVIEFIRYFYLDGLVYDYVFKSETYSLEDLRNVFEEHMDLNGKLPSFPFNLFHSQIKAEFENLGFLLQISVVGRCK